MQKPSNTKELFLIEALKLFAEKGYDSVSVAEVAAAVGCTPPALYRHYKSKQALLDSLLEMSENGFNKQMEMLNVDFRIHPEKRREFVHMPEKKQIEIIQQLLLHTFEDEMPSLFRKFMTIEQFHHAEFASQLNRRYVDSQFDAFESLMQEFINEGIYRDGNARAMAIQYASPVILYLSICDREPQRIDEAFAVIEEHVKQFNKAHKAE